MDSGSAARLQWLYLATAITLAVSYGFLLQRHLRAEAWATSADAAGLQRSLALEPGNAAVLHRLARLDLFAEQDVDKATRTLKHALEVNPHSPWIWLDLATARRIAGDSAGERAAMERATAADPRTPLIAWETASVLLLDGKTEAALGRLRVVVENDPQRAREALRLAWRASGSVPAVLKQATPETPSAHLAFIDVLLAERRTPEALGVWRAMIAKGIRPESIHTGRLLEYLVMEREVEGALGVWRDLSGDANSLSADERGQVSLVDPGFEDEPLTGGFRWRLQAAGGVTIGHDDAVMKSGNRSLRMDFSGNAVQLPGVEQWIPVAPGASYEISSMIRTESLETARPPRWFIQDAYTHQVLAKSEEWGTAAGWRQVAVNFTVPQATRMVALRVARDDASKLIRGRVWIDDVRMVKR